TVHPLPKREAQGEGKRRELPYACRPSPGIDELVENLRQSRRFPKPTMNPTNRVTWVIAWAVLGLSGIGWAQTEANQNDPPVTAPPETFFELVSERDRDVARQFYKKYIDVKGMPVVASGEVADLALQRTYSIVTHLLAGRPDVIEAMVKNRMYLIII